MLTPIAIRVFGDRYIEATLTNSARGVEIVKMSLVEAGKVVDECLASDRLQKCDVELLWLVRRVVSEMHPELPVVWAK